MLKIFKGNSFHDYWMLDWLSWVDRHQTVKTVSMSCDSDRKTNRKKLHAQVWQFWKVHAKKLFSQHRLACIFIRHHSFEILISDDISYFLCSNIKQKLSRWLLKKKMPNKTIHSSMKSTYRSYAEDMTINKLLENNSWQIIIV